MVILGLTLLSPKFSAPPCQVDCAVNECSEMTGSLFPTMPGNLHCLCRFFTAAIFYYSNCLKTILSLPNPFFSILLLNSSKIPKLIKQIFVKYAWEECSNISVYKGGYNVQDCELLSIIGDTERIVRDPLDYSASLEPQDTEASVLRRIPRISKATCITTHIMLLADIQKVIEAQHHFLVKMKIIINDEFDKRQVCHVIFQVQSQVAHMVSSFQDKNTKKVDEIGGDNDKFKSPSNSSTNQTNPFGGTGQVGR